MIAGPTTVTALLNSLSMGFKAVAINEKANEVRQLLAVTKAQYEKFGVVLEKAGKKIEEAGRTLDDAKKLALSFTEAGMSKNDAAKMAAKQSGLKKSDIYNNA